MKIPDDPAILIACIYSLSDNKDSSLPPWYREGTFHIRYLFRGTKKSQSVLLALVVSQVPLIKNNQ